MIDISCMPGWIKIIRCDLRNIRKFTFSIKKKIFLPLTFMNYKGLLKPCIIILVHKFLLS